MTVVTLQMIFHMIMTIAVDVCFFGSDGKHRVNWNRYPLITGSTVDAWQQQHPIFLSHNNVEREEQY